MLKRQLNLNLNGTLRANRIWSTIPAGSQQEIVEYYARLIGTAVNSEEANSEEANSEEANSEEANSEEVNDEEVNNEEVNNEEVNNEEVNDEEVNDEEVNEGPTRQRRENNWVKQIQGEEW